MDAVRAGAGGQGSPGCSCRRTHTGKKKKETLAVLSLSAVLGADVIRQRFLFPVFLPAPLHPPCRPQVVSITADS